MTLMGSAGICRGIGHCIVADSTVGRYLSHIIRELFNGSEQVVSASNQISAASSRWPKGDRAGGRPRKRPSLEEMSSMTGQMPTMQEVSLDGRGQGCQPDGTGYRGDVPSDQRYQVFFDQTAKIIRVIDDIAFQTNLLLRTRRWNGPPAGGQGVCRGGRGGAESGDAFGGGGQRRRMIEESVAAPITVSVTQRVSEAQRNLENADKVARSSMDCRGQFGTGSGIDQINTVVAQMDSYSTECRQCGRIRQPQRRTERSGRGPECYCGAIGVSG